MITPRFQLTQDVKTFTITIRAPYCSLKELEVQVDEETFLFYCKPYYLRMKLPGRIEEERNAHSKFDADSGEFTFTYDKSTPGETFENLDFITQFLSPKLEVQDGGRKIEILSSSAPNEDIVESEDQYGFAQRGGYKFNYDSTEYHDIFELNPHEVKLPDRKELRIKHEETTFNFDHYLADFIDCDEIDSLIQEKSPWSIKLSSKHKLETGKSSFTGLELDFLKNLPNITYELSPTQHQYAFTTLLDILYAYCYDRRSSCFEGSCESGWNILKLSSSMVWFDSFNTPKEAIIAGFRRALMFPLYRNFNLCSAVLEDLKDLLKLGETEIIKVLIEIYGIFLGGDSARYILNHLFIKDYVVYIQKWDKTKWKEIVDEVLNMEINKSDLGLNLEEIEELTNEDNLDEEEQSVENVLSKNMKSLSINNKNPKETKEELDSDDDESDDSDDTESDSEESSTETESETESDSE